MKKDDIQLACRADARFRTHRADALWPVFTV